MRFIYFIVWTPIFAFLGAITYVIATFDELSWVIVLVWFWPILFGRSIIKTIAEAREEERLSQDQADTEEQLVSRLESAGYLVGANRTGPPRVRPCTDSQ